MTNPHATDSAVGERLKKAREAAGVSLADISARSRIPARVLASLEAGDWAALGAPVYVRGLARSYARVLGLTLDDAALPSPFTTSQIPSLVSHVHVPKYRHVAEGLGRRAVYIVLTAALVVPVWLATRGHLDSTSAAIEPLDVAPGAASAPMPDARGPTPVVASMAPIPARAAASAPLVLELSGDNWVQIYGADGKVVERGLLRAGDRREFRPGEIGRVVLGNAAAARVLRDGVALDIAPYAQSNVARFTVSSDGSLAPIAPVAP